MTAASHGSADTDDGAEVPGWLNALAGSAERMAVPYALRPPPGGGRPAAVLILFGDGPGGPDLLLVQRSPWLRQHAGQPAFPGGGIDSADQGPVSAALREAAEEALVQPAGVEVLAVLPELYIWRSGFSVTPVLAWWRRPAPVGPGDPVEVSAVARVRVAELADPANRLMIRYPSGQASPAFRAAGMLIWGFTALLVDRLLALGGWELPWDTGKAEDLPAEYLALAQGSQTGQADPGGAEPGGAEPGGAEPGGAEPGGVEPGGVEPGGAVAGGVEPGGAVAGGAVAGGAEPGGAVPDPADPADPADPGIGGGRAVPGRHSPALLYGRAADGRAAVRAAHDQRARAAARARCRPPDAR